MVVLDDDIADIGGIIYNSRNLMVVLDPWWTKLYPLSTTVEI